MIYFNFLKCDSFLYFVYVNDIYNNVCNDLKEIFISFVMLLLLLFVLLLFVL